MGLLDRIEQAQKNKELSVPTGTDQAKKSASSQWASPQKKTPIYDPYKKKLIDPETNQEIEEESTNEGKEFAEGRGPRSWNA